ncbi:RNA polymerase sigma-70 factor, ECF subfamily [Mucilaginibacter sp. OK268]|jgi:RNA polymerase sigma-70 factor (ECF subfamily)|uniref:RNA polymerase sigma-70 factor n=1 Tax=Mucilaginibacter sp. OK268 TaxID=1881048 RepID=UPI0008857EB3|nr:RNA polymerase sigma-70 factor [Mucilaginibacter sp. OK268]SDP44172.1 RNA polymerase sigma-70 factor, ECF subfamily [Mucilaginibacter sp. OK268]
MKAHLQYSDEELTGLIQSDELVAFEEIYNRYWYKMYVFTNKRLRCKEASEEIVQNFFTKFWQNRNTIKIDESLKAYLFSSISYLIINHIKKEALKNQYLQLSYTAVEDQLDNSTEDIVHLNDLQSIIDKELEKLPVRCRSVFELSRKGNKSNKEIAHVLNISEKTVENHITNAIRYLRINLKNSLLFALLVFRHHL